MKYRPLKGADFYAKELYYSKGDGDRIKVFKAENIKSAVQGLLEEIESRIKELDRYEEMGFTKQFCANRRDEIKTYIIPLIKKWFADVIDKEEER